MLIELLYKSMEGMVLGWCGSLVKEEMCEKKKNLLSSNFSLISFVFQNIDSS